VFPSEYVLAIKCDIKLEFVDEWRGIKNDSISEKGLKGYTLSPNLWILLFFLRCENGMLEHIYLSKYASYRCF
jgi:hypothetical protein